MKRKSLIMVSSLMVAGLLCFVFMDAPRDDGGPVGLAESVEIPPESVSSGVMDRSVSNPVEVRGVSENRVVVTMVRVDESRLSELGFDWLIDGFGSDQKGYVWPESSGSN